MLSSQRREPLWRREPDANGLAASRFVRDGVLSNLAPAQVIQRLQRSAGNQAVTTALAANQMIAVQPLSLFGKKKASNEDIFEPHSGNLSDNQATLLSEMMSDPLRYPKAWGLFKQFAGKEFSTENTTFHEEYYRSQAQGGGGPNQKLMDMALEKDYLNVRKADQDELRKKWEAVFWERPLSAFEKIENSVKANLSDTMSRFRFTKAADMALSDFPLSKRFVPAVKKLFGVKK